MKVLHVIDSGGLYGAEMVLLTLAAEQVKMGLDPVIGSIGEKDIAEKPLETEALRRGLKVRKFRFANGPNVFGTIELLRFCRKEGVDIIHTHGYKGNILLGFVPKRLRRVPLIATLHGWTGTSADAKLRLYEWIDARSLRFMDAVVLVSEAMRHHPRLAGRTLPNMRVVLNGVAGNGTDPALKETATAEDLDRSIIDFCRGSYVVGSIGRLSVEKGYPYLIEALHLLIQRGIDAKLVIIGEGDERKALEGLAASLGLRERVFMPGYRKEARLYLPCFDVFVLPSMTEGLPVTLLEAMQAGTPIIATDVGGVPALVEAESDGLVVPPGDARALADAMDRVRQDGALAARLAEHARAKVRDGFTGGRMCREYAGLYSEASSRRSGNA